jgi:3-methyl-2-oxobutanoate hydroxymethyltransferase
MSKVQLGGGSHASATGKKKLTIRRLHAKKKKGEKITMLTCYDSSFAKILEHTPVDMVLVGDSLGNIVMGYDNTIPVTLDDVVHHTACVSRSMQKTFIVADMPFGSYLTVETAAQNAVRIMQEGGAHAVKLEGGEEILPQIKAILAAGIPVVGHLGLQPQSQHKTSGYRVQGRDESGAKRMQSDAKKLEAAGVSLVVFELVPAELAKKITEDLEIPTIGIGAGSDTDGQVLVLQDMLGFDPGFEPTFLKKYANFFKDTVAAVEVYCSDVQSKEFPSRDHSFS